VVTSYRKQIGLVGAVGIEPTTFGLKVGNCALQQTTATGNTQRNQRKAPIAFGSRRTVLYRVHGQLHGQFRTIITSEEKRNRCQHSVLTYHSPPCRLTRRVKTLGEFDLDTHRHISSLLQSNVPKRKGPATLLPGQVKLSQAEHHVKLNRKVSSRAKLVCSKLHSSETRWPCHF
jgi:hypothetical protein